MDLALIRTIAPWVVSLQHSVSTDFFVCWHRIFTPKPGNTLDPLTDVKLTDPFHFLWRAGDLAAQCMMDTPWRVDCGLMANRV